MKNNHFLIKILTILLLSAYSGIGISQPVTWYRTWGLYNRYEQGNRVVQTFDGGYAVLVETGNQIISWNTLLKYSSIGNLLWTKTIIDSSSERFLVDMKQTNDSGFILSGWSSGALLVKTDNNGNLQWQRNYPNLNPETKFNSIQQTTDKGYIASGWYTDYVNPSSKGIVIKTDSLGYVQWEKQYMDSIQNGFGGIIQGLDGKYYVAGSTKNNYPSKSYALIKKLDLFGNVLWTNIFYSGGSASNIVQLRDGSIITASGVDSITYQNRPLLAKLDTSGNIKWVKYFPSPYLWYQYMSKDLLDRIILTGLYNIGGGLYTIGIWKLDSGGIISKTKQLNFSGYNYISSSCINRTSDSGYILVGNATLTDSLFNPHGDALIIKADSNFNTPLITGINFVNSNYINEFKLFQNYPNPFNSSTNIIFILPGNGYVNINIYDALGKNVFSSNEFRDEGLNEKKFDFHNLNISSGIYFIQIIFNAQKKLIKSIFLK
jgi:hypothetical protein